MAPCAPPPASLRPGSAVLGALVPWWSVGGLLPPVRPRRSARACVRAAGVGPLRSLASLGGGAVRRDAPRGLWLVVRGCLGSSVCAAARPLGGALACGCALVWGVFVVRAPGGARVGRLRAFGGACVCGGVPRAAPPGVRVPPRPLARWPVVEGVGVWGGYQSFSAFPPVPSARCAAPPLGWRLAALRPGCRSG